MANKKLKDIPQTASQPSEAQVSAPQSSLPRAVSPFMELDRMFDSLFARN